MTAVRGSAISTQEHGLSAKPRPTPRGILAPLAIAFAFLLSPIRVSAQALAPSIVTVQASPQLFATMCALYAAGFEADVSSDAVNPVIAQLRTDLLALRGPAAQALRKYYHEHELADATETMSRFVTFALVVGPAPKFEFTLDHEDLPPDALALEGFNQVLGNFYQEAQLERVWKQVDPSYEQAAQYYRAPLSEIVMKESGYLRELLRPGRRTFSVYVEPLVGRRTNVRNIGNQYAVVVNPEIDSLDRISHAFLHFLIDPLPIRYADNVAAESPLLLQAERAPRLPNEFRDDVSGFFTECLVRSVELRLRRLPAPQLADQVNAQESDGYVMVRPLMTALTKFEASEPAMSLYFPALVKSIDVAAEVKRLQTLTFPPASNEVAGGDGPDVTPSGRANLEATLTAGEKAIAAQDAATAQAAFELALKQVPGQPRALYGLAVAFVLQANAVRARELFVQVVGAASVSQASLRPDPVALAWSHVYLGRMDDLQGDREQALVEYQAALLVEDAPESARVAAQRGLEQAYEPVKKGSSPG